MQCQSYFPVYHSNYDLNLDANGSNALPMPIHNINGSFQSGHYSKYVSSSPAPRPQGPVELLRQTILSHEATFRDQVQELHRLYKRQKELMGELRSKPPHRDHSYFLEGQSSNSFSQYLSSHVGQNTPHTLPLVNLHYKPSMVGTYNTQTPVESVKDTRISAPAFLQSEGARLHNLEDTPESKSKGRKIGGKLLDLELPAEVYIDDSEDGESFEDAKLSEPPVSTCLSSSKPGSFGQSNCNVTDLNEPTTGSCSGKNDGVMGNKEMCCSTQKFAGHKVDLTSSELCSGSSQRNPSSTQEKNPNCMVVQALPCLANQAPSRKGAKMTGMNMIKSGCSESRLKGSGVSASSVTSDLIDLNSEFVPGTANGETARKGKKCRLIDINLPCSLDDTDGEIVSEDDHCVTDDGIRPNSTQSHKIPLQIDLEAPLSPEVEERAPPRGGSEENDPDIRNPLLELAKAAAEAIVSISSSSSTSSSEPEPCHETDGSTTGGGALEWFAGLIQTMSRDLDDDSKLDEFEALTLELAETTEDEYWTNRAPQILSSSSSSSALVPPGETTTRRGRTTRRSRRKDFQREVLPSLTSLTRYEVSEDILMIEGLMEAAGTPWQHHLTRAARRGSRMGRKPRATTTTTTATVAKQPVCVADSDVPEVKDEAFIAWGRTHSRSRRNRHRANLDTVLTRWLVFSAAY